MDKSNENPLLKLNKAYPEADYVISAKGDNLINLGINDGDLLFIKSCTFVKSGKLAVVVVNNKTLVKRMYYSKVYENLVILLDEKETDKVMLLADDEIKNLKVIGEVIGFFKYL